MLTLPSNATLKAAALDALTLSGEVAWEESHRQRALTALSSFSTGGWDTATMRAALAPARPAAVREGQAPGVAVLALVGVLTPTSSFFTMLGMGTSLSAFGQQLRAAAADPSVKSIIVLTDSPGGYVGLVPETAALMRQARAQKPVTAVVSGMNASASYWVTSNASRIEATPSALVGSIGVITTRASYARQLDAAGIDVEVISAGTYKGEGLPETAMSDAERAATQARVDETYGVFVSDVAAGRGVQPGTVRQGFGQGRAVSARQALSMGMIDQVAIVEDAVGRALSLITGGRAMTAAQERAEEAQTIRLRAKFGDPDAEAAADDAERRRRLKFERF